MKNYKLINDDCVHAMKEMAENSIDSIVTDPPYELGFMGKSWDASGIAYNVEMWAEALRILKPGGHLLAFGGSRTYHRLAVAIEDAGFQIRDSIAWIYGSGFPKSLDVSKAIDKSMGENRKRQLQFTAWMRSTGLQQTECAAIISNFAKNDATAAAMAQHYYSDKQQPAIPTLEIFNDIRRHIPTVPEEIERLVVERTGIEWTEYKNRQVIGQTLVPEGHAFASEKYGNSADVKEIDKTLPATTEAKQWQGWGTALKPAIEPIVVARKPLIGTVAENVLTHGVGGLNIDGCRIGTDGGGTHCTNRDEFDKCKGHDNAGRSTNGATVHGDNTTAGRWPANIILDEVTAALVDEQSGTSKSPSSYVRNSDASSRVFGSGKGDYESGSLSNGHGDTGGASRFFYVAKANKRDRNEGLEDLEAVRHADRIKDDGAGGENPRNRTNQTRQNFHPTVKPTQLMRYLVRLVTPPDGTVLDPFMGSGSTGKAAMLESFDFIGIEQSADYMTICEKRIEHAKQQVESEPEQQILF